jgi:hypothetical protein
MSKACQKLDAQVQSINQTRQQGCQMVLFHTQKKQFRSTLEGPLMENVDIFYDRMEYVRCGHVLHFMAVRYSLWSFGIFFPFCYVWAKKNLATLLVANSFTLVSSP